MTDTESIVGRCVPGSKARTAESCLNNGSCCHKVCKSSVPCKLRIDRRTCRIYAESELVRANALSLKYIRCCTYILEAAACTACNNSLLNIELSVYHLVLECKRNLIVQAHRCTLLYVIKDIHQVSIEFFNGIYIARMERHCNHRLNAAKVYIDNSVIVGHITRVKLTIALTTAMYLIEILNFIISSPY